MSPPAVSGTRHLAGRITLGVVATLVAMGVDWLAYYTFGIRSGVFVANGIVTSCVLVFLLSLLAFYDPEQPASFLTGPTVRTAIAITFSIAYLELLACGLVASNLGLNFNNPLMSNFFWVYSTIIAFYFGSEAAERVAEKRNGSGGDARPPKSPHAPGTPSGQQSSPPLSVEENH